MSASRKDFQRLAYELAQCQPIALSDDGPDVLLGLVVPNDTYDAAHDAWNRAKNAVARACRQMNANFDDDRFDIACRARAYHRGMHGE